MSKRFKASWGTDYYEPSEREVGLDFFAVDVGHAAKAKTQSMLWSWVKIGDA